MNVFYSRSFQLALWLIVTVGSVAITVFMFAALWGRHFAFEETHHSQPVDFVWGLIVSVLFTTVSLVKFGRLLLRNVDYSRHGARSRRDYRITKRRSH
jgi:hypothetical protein